MRGWSLPLVLALSVGALAGCIKVELGGPVAQPVEAASASGYSGPQVDFSWSPSTPRVGEKVSFTPTVKVLRGTGVTEWRWTFGDGTGSDEPQPRTAYFSEGLKTVTLVALGSDGKTGQAQHVVPVIAARDRGGEGVPEPAGPPVIRAHGDGLGFRFWFVWNGTPDAAGWDFGDGVTSNETSPSHSYALPGNYAVRLHLLVGSSILSAGLNVTSRSTPPVFRVVSVGEEAAEPSIGITSSGCMFYAAFEKAMRSCDFGATWENTNGLLSSPVSFDPWLWVDPVTDRIFNVQMIYLACTWISWSDDDGESWLGNPEDCGTVPVNDHIKLATGPWAGAENPLAQNPVYPQAVYFCHNKLVTVECCTSVDGGATFALCQPAGSGGLHGAVTAGPDGTVYVPPRSETPSVHISRDNGLTWETRTMGQDQGTPEPRKNSEVATDTGANAYHTWIGADFGVYLSRSGDQGKTWDPHSLRASPAEVVSATFVHAQAGDPGRIAIAYLGSEDADRLGEDDIDGEPWGGNPHTAPAGVRHHLYVTFSLNALDPAPAWTTVRVTDDPVQVGSICISSGDCRDIGGSNRNLLDFNDLSLDREGRAYVAFADGCTSEKCRGPDGTPEDSRDAAGVVAILETGPSLYGNATLAARGRLARSPYPSNRGTRNSEAPVKTAV